MAAAKHLHQSHRRRSIALRAGGIAQKQRISEKKENDGGNLLKTAEIFNR
jgi:hypothetical protein